MGFDGGPAGLGVSLPTASLGLMVSDDRNLAVWARWMLARPALFSALAVGAPNLPGDASRDAPDESGEW